ncbi:hypothetical protein DXG01_006395 [Tephrocybe rancida]|nr:hypothetical protein DXG01_006395 [Tephrocybe rancida]
MFHAILGLHRGQSRKLQKMLASKAMIRVVLAKKNNVKTCRTFHDLTLVAWSKIDFDCSALGQEQLALRTCGIEETLATSKKLDPEGAWDFLIGSYSVVVLPDPPTDSAEPSPPAEGEEKSIAAAVLETFVCNGISSSLASSDGPCGAGFPEGLAASDIELLLRAQLDDSDRKVEKAKELKQGK